jgi:hypothetical protein
MVQDKLLIFGGLIINISSYQTEKKRHMIPLTDCEVIFRDMVYF